MCWEATRIRRAGSSCISPRSATRQRLIRSPTDLRLSPAMRSWQSGERWRTRAASCTLAGCPRNRCGMRGRQLIALPLARRPYLVCGAPQVAWRSRWDLWARTICHVLVDLPEIAGPAGCPETTLRLVGRLTHNPFPWQPFRYRRGGCGRSAPHRLLGLRRRRPYRI